MGWGRRYYSSTLRTTQHYWIRLSSERQSWRRVARRSGDSELRRSSKTSRSDRRSEKAILRSAEKKKWRRRCSVLERRDVLFDCCCCWKYYKVIYAKAKRAVNISMRSTPLNSHFNQRYYPLRPSSNNSQQSLYFHPSTESFEASSDRILIIFHLKQIGFIRDITFYPPDIIDAIPTPFHIIEIEVWICDFACRLPHIQYNMTCL